jgi:hypothetical protein
LKCIVAGLVPAIGILAIILRESRGPHQDIDRPNAGFITVSQQPMVDAASLSSYSD